MPAQHPFFGGGGGGDPLLCSPGLLGCPSATYQLVLSSSSQIWVWIHNTEWPASARISLAKIINWFMLGQRTHQRQKVVVSFLCQGRLWKGGRFLDQALPDVCKGTRQVHVLRGCWLMNCPLQRIHAQRPLHLKLSAVRLQNHPRVADRGHGWRLLSTSLPLHPLLRFLHKWAALLCLQTKQWDKTSLDNFSGSNHSTLW